MPKSKRDKKISLTKTDKKGLGLKQKVIEDVRNCVEKYNSLYVFTYKNMRNVTMKTVREEWKPSRFFFGKNRCIAVGLGRSKEDEIADEIHKLSECLKGQCGLLFTDSPKKEVVEWFDDYSYQDYARSGFKATETIKLSEGPLKKFPHSMEPYLRKLGLPTKLDKGVVTLLRDYEVCKKGSILTPEQAKVLELLDHRLATFKLSLRACWIKDEGFEKFEEEEESEAGSDNDDQDEMEED